MKKLCGKLSLVLITLCCAASGARGQGADGGPANRCREDAFTSDAKEFKVARVEGERGARVYFYGDAEGCPGPAAKCRQKSFVVAGDEVLVSRTFGDWMCAWYQPAKGRETIGWLAAHQLGDAAAPDANPPLAAWLGAWDFNAGSLRLSRGAKRGALRVAGEAFWTGANPGNVHTGGVSGEAAPAGRVLTIEEDPCRLTLRLVGNYLVADDNGECGGVNVTFDGVYRRKPSAGKRR
jgi:hypothetical protein